MPCLERRLHVFAEHPVLVADLPFVTAHEQAVGVIVDGLTLGNAVHGCEIPVGHDGRIAPEGIERRYVPLDEDLQLMPVDEAGGIGDDRTEETLILLIAAQLCFSEVFSGSKSLSGTD